MQAEPRREAAEDLASAPADLLEIARARLREGQPGEVTSLVERILKADPNNAEAHLLSAYVHADSGEYDEALAACHRALAINPLLPVARYILGIIYQRQGDQVHAISELKKSPEGDWTEFSGGFQADLLAKTCERSLLECRKAMGST